MLSSGARRAVKAWTVLVLVFLYAPMVLVIVNAFNKSRTFSFPPRGFTLRWWADTWNSTGMWTSLGNSVVVGLCATAIALVLGTMAAFAVQRYDFFGRNTVSFLVVLPITCAEKVTELPTGTVALLVLTIVLLLCPWTTCGSTFETLGPLLVSPA